MKEREMNSATATNHNNNNNNSNTYTREHKISVEKNFLMGFYLYYDFSNLKWR